MAAQKKLQSRYIELQMTVQLAPSGFAAMIPEPALDIADLEFGIQPGAWI